MAKGQLEGADSPLSRIRQSAFEQLPKDERIKLLVGGLRREDVLRRDEDAIGILYELEFLCAADGVPFRAYLREIYSGFPSDARSLKLRLAILGKILAGWKLSGWHTTSEGLIQGHGPDARNCFSYICSVFVFLKDPTDVVVSQSFSADLRRGICELFREHIGNHPDFTDNGPESLDEWIVSAETPDEIANIMLHAQLRLLEGVKRARASILFLRRLSEMPAREGIMKEFRRDLAHLYADC